MNINLIVFIRDIQGNHLKGSKKQGDAINYYYDCTCNIACIYVCSYAVREYVYVPVLCV